MQKTYFLEPFLYFFASEGVGLIGVEGNFLWPVHLSNIK